MSNIPLCIYCQRRIYYPGKITCGKRDCSINFKKEPRDKVISPLKLGYKILNYIPFTNGDKPFIINPELYRSDHYYSYNDCKTFDHRHNKRIVDTFDFKTIPEIIKKNNKTIVQKINNEKKIDNDEWNDLMMDIYAYQGKIDEVKNLFKKGYLPTQSTLFYGVLSNNIETVKWLNRLVPLREDLFEKIDEELNYEIYEYINKNIVLTKKNQFYKFDSSNEINLIDLSSIIIPNQMSINYFHQLQYLHNCYIFQQYQQFQQIQQYMYICEQNFI